MRCKFCKKEFHWCSSCGLSSEEEAPYENGLCDTCWEKSGAKKIYDEELRDLEGRKLVAQLKIEKAVNYYCVTDGKPAPDGNDGEGI